MQKVSGSRSISDGENLANDRGGFRNGGEIIVSTDSIRP